MSARCETPHTGAKLASMKPISDIHPSAFHPTAIQPRSARETRSAGDARAAAALAARGIGPLLSRGATVLLIALADASAMSLVTPPRNDVR